jgi:hypothetical protein
MILAGAGVSFGAPASMPMGGMFNDEVIQGMTPQGVDPTEVLSLAEPSSEPHRPGEFLRFEVMMGSIAQAGLDSRLTVLDCLDECKVPNRNHWLLAKLIRAGHVVMTVNVDRLVELAYENLPDSAPQLRVAYRDGDFPPEGPPVGAPPTLWKLHGSLSVSGCETRQSVQASFTSVLSPFLSRRKRRFFRQALATHDLLVIGYSGWDDLDLVPLLAETPSNRRLVWINHQSGAPPALEDPLEMRRRLNARWSDDVVGRHRLLFAARGSAADLGPRRETLIMISGDTDGILELLAEEYLGERLPEAGEASGVPAKRGLEQHFAAWRRDCAERPIAQYSAIKAVLENRMFRPEASRFLATIATRLEELRASPEAAPEDRLDRLINRYQFLVRIGGRTDLESLMRLRKVLTELLPSLPVKHQGAGRRLLARMTWTLGKREAASDMFVQAASLDEECDNPAGELATLVTWLEAEGTVHWRDLFPSEEGEDELYTPEALLERFPIAGLRRIHELVRVTGYFPKVWEIGLAPLCRAIEIGLNEGEPSDGAEQYEALRKVRRFSVDLGDVRGEAKATLALGELHLSYGEDNHAVIELLRATELTRLTKQVQEASDAATYLRIAEERVGGIDKAPREDIRTSLWGPSSAMP